MAKKKTKQKQGIPGEKLLSSPPDSVTERFPWLIIQSYYIVEYAKKHQLSKRNKFRLFVLVQEECKNIRTHIADFVGAVGSIGDQGRLDLYNEYDLLYEDLEKLVRESLRNSTAKIEGFFFIFQRQFRLMQKMGVISKIEADARVRGMRNGFAILAKELHYDLKADLKVGDKKGESQDSLANDTPLENEPREAVGVTLTEFMKQYCEGSLSDSILDSKKKSLFKANKKEYIELPEHEGLWKRGKPKRFDPEKLKKEWPKYRIYNTSLPCLKSTNQ